MNADRNSNASASATPQPNGPSRYSKLTEAEFLAHEADLAKTAISNALAELKTNVAKAADVKLWAHHYPWLTVGVAAATGFTLATIATSSNGDGRETEGEEETRQRLLREAAKVPYNSAAVGAKPKLGDSLLGSLFSLARTALEASLVSAIRTEGMERSQAAAQACPVTNQPFPDGSGRPERAASDRY
jgi:hypothetical protein